MFPSKLTTVFSVLAAAVAVSAAPARTFSGPKVDVVFRPNLTAPQGGEVWAVGSTQTISWETDNIPEENKNQTGLILLGYIQGDSIDEHLDVSNPLAVNFPITAGKAEVTVPDVPERDDYVVVLFGDSGNASPKFTISKAGSSSAAASGSASASIPSISIPAIPSISFPGAPSSVPSIPSAPSTSVESPSVSIPAVPTGSASASVSA
ncbi:hypothetical protein C8Q78DRAFT_981399 [Trametes maxima]|nr:hypothetical protein C8Q78DRAFT_981399 [Trametes maxima]